MASNTNDTKKPRLTDADMYVLRDLLDETVQYIERAMVAIEDAGGGEGRHGDDTPRTGSLGAIGDLITERRPSLAISDFTYAIGRVQGMLNSARDELQDACGALEEGLIDLHDRLADEAEDDIKEAAAVPAPPEPSPTA
jgi:hypothetical protein